MTQFSIGGIHQNHRIQNFFGQQDLRPISNRFGRIGVVGLTVRQDMANPRDSENVEDLSTNQRVENAEDLARRREIAQRSIASKMSVAKEFFSYTVLFT